MKFSVCLTSSPILKCLTCYHPINSLSKSLFLFFDFNDTVKVVDVFTRNEHQKYPFASQKIKQVQRGLVFFGVFFFSEMVAVVPIPVLHVLECDCLTLNTAGFNRMCRLAQPHQRSFLLPLSRFFWGGGVFGQWSQINGAKSF